MSQAYNKSTRKKLGKLSEIAHERELAKALEKLRARFEEWQSQKIDVFELSDYIHEFHQKKAREIWKMYVSKGLDDILVSRALKLGILAKEEVGEELLKQLGPLIDYWQNDSNEG